MIQHRPSSSSLQHNVVLHSNINESSILTISPEKDDQNQQRRKANSLMTVHEQDSSSDLLMDDSWHLRSPTSASDVTHKLTTDDEKQTV